MPITLITVATALALAAPLHARTIPVAAGDGAQTRLQEALINAQPGDVVELGAGRFVLSDGLSLDASGVTLRGAGMEASVLDFSTQQGAGEGLLVTSDDVTLRDFAVENPHGDGIKSKGADRVVYYRVRVTWTGGPKETNGAYGLYPVESTGVLIDGCKVSGASDAGIYVGQSKGITVRYSTVENSVAGIEIENSRDALVTGNFVTRNTGGILVFDLPNLPVMGGGNTIVKANLVASNDTPNFAPKGNIVAGVPMGTGIMVMANDRVSVLDNLLADNSTAQILIVSYPKPFQDPKYIPTPRGVYVGGNQFDGKVTGFPLPGTQPISEVDSPALPPILWDGLGQQPWAANDNNEALSLNLPKQGAGVEQSRPSEIKLTPPMIAPLDRSTLAAPNGAPVALAARIRP